MLPYLASSAGLTVVPAATGGVQSQEAGSGQACFTHALLTEHPKQILLNHLHYLVRLSNAEVVQTDGLRLGSNVLVAVSHVDFRSDQRLSQVGGAILNREHEKAGGFMRPTMVKERAEFLKSG